MTNKKEKCYFCKGTLKNKEVTVDYRWGDELVIVEKVPALVCTQCGEEVYEGAVIEKLEQVVKASQKKKTVSISVKNFSEFENQAAIF